MLREFPVEDVVPLPVETGAQAAGSRRFTRVTVVGPTRRVDVSVPDDLPVALVIEQVRPAGRRRDPVGPHPPGHRRPGPGDGPA